MPWEVEAGSLQKFCSFISLYVLTHNLALLRLEGILGEGIYVRTFDVAWIAPDWSASGQQIWFPI